MTEEEIKALQAELEGIKAELVTTKTDLDTTKAELQGAKDIFVEKETAFTELEQSVAAKDAEIVTLKQTVSTGEADKATLALTIKAETQQAVTDLTDSYTEAVSAYKAVVASANPAVPVQLITGDTIEAVDASLESAVALVTQVRLAVEADIAAGKVPAGAPPRTAPDLSTLSAREKIAYAVTKSKV